MIPEKIAALFARGREAGYNRLVLGVHYPTDVEAGRLLATAVATAHPLLAAANLVVLPPAPTRASCRRRLLVAGAACWLAELAQKKAPCQLARAKVTPITWNAQGDRGRCCADRPAASIGRLQGLAQLGTGGHHQRH
jgi:membrane-associated phospholipid phosphatase